MRRQGSALSVTVVLGLALFALLGFLPFSPHLDVRRPAPTLLVLGAAQYNGHPSPVFRRRLDRALALYRAGGVRRIVVSGGVGRGDHFSEGAVGAAYLARQGVPTAALTAETHSRDTVENLRYSRPLIPGPVTLVTDEAHAPRALALAKALGFRATISSAHLTARDDTYRRRERLLLAAYALIGVGDREQRLGWGAN